MFFQPSGRTSFIYRRVARSRGLKEERALIYESNNPSIQQRLNLLIHIYLAGLCNIQAIDFSLVGAGAFSLIGTFSLTGTFSLIGAGAFSLISSVLIISLTGVV
jgi:hypothetical protein